MLCTYYLVSYFHSLVYEYPFKGMIIYAQIVHHFGPKIQGLAHNASYSKYYTFLNLLKLRSVRVGLE